MAGKKILAGIFAVLVLVKLIFLVAAPAKWLGLVGVVLAHHNLLMVIYLGLICLTGYYVLVTLDLIDVAVVMLFTGLLMGLSMLSFSAALLKLPTEVVNAGPGKGWYALAIWAIIALAVLYRVFSGRRR